MENFKHFAVILTIFILGLIFYFAVPKKYETSITNPTDLSNFQKIIYYNKNHIKIGPVTSPFLFGFYSQYYLSCKKDKEKLIETYEKSKELLNTPINETDTFLLLRDAEYLCQYSYLVNKDYIAERKSILNFLNGTIYNDIFNSSSLNPVSRYQREVQYLMAFSLCANRTLSRNEITRNSMYIINQIDKNNLDNYTYLWYGIALLKTYEVTNNSYFLERAKNIFNTYIASHRSNGCFSFRPGGHPDPVCSYVSLLFLRDYANSNPSKRAEILKMMNDCVTNIPELWMDPNDGGIIEYYLLNNKPVMNKNLATNTGYGEIVSFMYRMGYIKENICEV